MTLAYLRTENPRIQPPGADMQYDRDILKYLRQPLIDSMLKVSRTSRLATVSFDILLL